MIWLVSFWCGFSLSWVCDSVEGYICPLRSFLWASLCFNLSHSHTFFYYWCFWVIKRVFSYLFSMPVSLAQLRGEIIYNNTLVFPTISIFYLLLSLSYGSIFCRLDLIRLLFLIISLILNGIMFFHFKKYRNNNLKIGVYLFTTIYLLIMSKLSRLILVRSLIR